MRLIGTTSLITGASSGIGAAVASALADAGSRPLLAGRDPERLAGVARRTGGVAIPADMSGTVRPPAGTATSEPAGPAGAATGVDGAAAVGDRVLAVTDRLDVLVNNAGIGWAGPFPSMADADVERLAAVNLLAPIRLTRRLLPALEAARGRVVFVTSIAGRTAVPGEAVYAATKAGLHMFADALREELVARGVGVSVVVPGVVATPFFDRRGVPYARAWPRPVSAERVARAVVSALERDRPEVFVPGWMRLPARLHGGAPALFRALARLSGSAPRT